MICERQKCTACGACLNICPVDAIKMEEDSCGFYQISIDQDICINCNACKKACPITNDKNVVERELSDTAYAWWNLDQETRASSSSGGAFGVLGSYILEEGGVVYGAAYLEDLSVAHIKIVNLKELPLLQQSKYVQSSIGTTYKDVKCELDEGKRVLFSGTPCQVAGLYGYLGRDYDQLLTCELVCHGVPSSGIFRTYLTEMCRKYNSEIDKINFRHKENGKTQNFMILFKNNEKYSPLNKTVWDNYYFGFMMNLFLHDACHHCKFVQRKNRTADFIIGDFWGLEKAACSNAPDKSPSLVLLNSLKAREVFIKMESAVYCVEKPIEAAVPYNSTLGGVFLNQIDLENCFCMSTPEKILY